MLKIIREHLKPDQRVFVGVIAPIDPRIETPEEVRDRVLEAAGYIPLDQLGTTDDCGFSPFSDDISTSRDTAFAKIRARVLGTALAPRPSEPLMMIRDRRREQLAAVGRHAERAEHPARAPARRAGAAERQGSAREKTAGAGPLAGPDGRDPGGHHRRHPGDRRGGSRHRLQREFARDVAAAPRRRRRG